MCPPLVSKEKRKKLLIKNRYQEIRNYLLISVLKGTEKKKAT